MKEQVKSLRELASDGGLIFIETTNQMNGYPSQIEGAIIGFRTYEEAEVLAKEYGLQITTFQKRDGWQLWYRTMNSVTEAFTNSCEDFGDDYFEFGKMSEADFLEEEFFPLVKDCSSFEKLDNLIKEKRELFEAIENLEKDEIVISYCGAYYDTLSKESMYFYHDTKHTAIGVMSHNNE